MRGTRLNPEINVDRPLRSFTLLALKLRPTCTAPHLRGQPSQVVPSEAAPVPV